MSKMTRLISVRSACRLHTLLQAASISTGHYGEQDRNGAGVDPQGYYIKVGQKLGKYNLSLAYQEVNDLAAEGDTAERINLSGVYNIGKGIELFAAYQTASLDRAGGVSLEDVDQFSIGSRIKF